MRYFGRTDIGKERSINEDAFLMLDENPMFFFVVADGMGGHAAGEVASHLVTSTMEEYMQENIPALKEQSDAETILRFLATMIGKANTRVWLASRNNEDQQGMGTTTTAVFMDYQSYYVGHVGDSRAYLVNSQGISQITRDHSLVEQLVEQGQIDKDEAKNHPQRNVLTRALGTDEEVQVDFYTGTWKKADMLLLCTDGLTSLVSEDEILLVCKNSSSEQEIVDNLLKMANTRGGHDNITVVAVKVE